MPPPAASATASAAPSGVPASCSSDVPPGSEEPKPTFDQAPRDTIDPDATYTATIDTSCGTIRVDLLAETRDRGGQQLRLPGQERLL